MEGIEINSGKKILEEEDFLWCMGKLQSKELNPEIGTPCIIRPPFTEISLTENSPTRGPKFTQVQRLKFNFK
jgi:hypothetical protein